MNEYVPHTKEERDEIIRKLWPHDFDPRVIEIDKLVVFIETYRKTRDIRIADIIIDAVEKLIAESGIAK